MNRRDVHALLVALDRFIDDVDRSPQLATEIEGILIECCQAEPWFDDVSEALALFVPGGGGFYIDEEALAVELVSIAAVLRKQVMDEN